MWFNATLIGGWTWCCGEFRPPREARWALKIGWHEFNPNA